MLMFTGFEFALSFTLIFGECPGHRHHGARSGDVAGDPQCGRGRRCLAFGDAFDDQILRHRTGDRVFWKRKKNHRNSTLK